MNLRGVAQGAKIVSKINSQSTYFNSLFVLSCKIRFYILVHSYSITIRLLFPSKSKVLLYKSWDEIRLPCWQNLVSQQFPPMVFSNFVLANDKREQEQRTLNTRLLFPWYHHNQFSSFIYRIICPVILFSDRCSCSLKYYWSKFMQYK
jgi:hypothetical protein